MSAKRPWNPFFYRDTFRLGWSFLAQAMHPNLK
jgi:hypothetical protein